ncbi:hypothetical protein Q7P37_000441 [Cladosporium fusiforme]
MPRTQDGFIWSPSTSGRHGLTTDAIMSNTRNVEDHYDVIVIGAGFAGLTAARDLATSGDLSVLMVEARDRIGGRTYTVKELGEEYELGGQWVHWWQPNVYRELSRYGLDRNLVAAKAGAEDIMHMTEDEIEAALADFLSIDGLTAQELMPWPMDIFREPAPWKKYDHLSLREKLDMMPDLSQEARYLIELNYGGVSGTSAEETSFTSAVRWYALGGYSFAGSTAVGGTSKIGNGGLTSLARLMASETPCDRLFDTAVTRVAQDDEEVTVDTEDGRTLKAGSVVSTIPLNVLSTIKFEPPLPDLKQEAINRGMPHRGGKIIIELNEKQPCDLTGTSYGQSPFIFSMENNYNVSKNGTTAIAFTWPDGFSASNDLDDADVIAPALNDFMKPKSPIKAYLVHDWANDPYSKGAWMSYRPGEMSKYSEALQKSHGRVVMASADWANGFAGFVDGAIERGAKAATDVKGLLGVAQEL